MLSQKIGLNKTVKIFDVEFSVLEMTKEMVHEDEYCNMYIHVHGKNYIGLINYKNPINDKYKLYDDIELFYPILDWIVSYNIVHNNNNNFKKMEYDLINNYDYKYSIKSMIYQCIEIFTIFNKVFTQDEIKQLNNMVAYF